MLGCNQQMSTAITVYICCAVTLFLNVEDAADAEINFQYVEV